MVLKTGEQNIELCNKNTWKLLEVATHTDVTVTIVLQGSIDYATSIDWQEAFPSPTNNRDDLLRGAQNSNTWDDHNFKLAVVIISKSLSW